MEVFSQLFAFYSFLLTLKVEINGFSFSLMGAIAFAAFIFAFLAFLHWLLNVGD